MKIASRLSLVIVICFVACKSFVTTTLESDLFEETLKRVSNPQLIDVRTPKEFKEGHLPGAILIDIKASDFDKAILNLDAQQPVFVYCRSGKRSLEAAKILEKNKYKVVYNLAGGINAWKEKGKVVAIPE